MGRAEVTAVRMHERATAERVGTAHANRSSPAFERDPTIQERECWPIVTGGGVALPDIDQQLRGQTRVVVALRELERACPVLDGGLLCAQRVQDPAAPVLGLRQKLIVGELF